MCPSRPNSAFLVDIPSEGWEVVRDVETMSGSNNHCEIRIADLRVHRDKMLGAPGSGHLLGQYRLGPARLAHCMRWIGQAETALEMMVDRALGRYSHGSVLAEKQGIQWLIADSTISSTRPSSWCCTVPISSMPGKTTPALSISPARCP